MSFQMQRLTLEALSVLAQNACLRASVRFIGVLPDQDTSGSIDKGVIVYRKHADQDCRHDYGAVDIELPFMGGIGFSERVVEDVLVKLLSQYTLDGKCEMTQETAELPTENPVQNLSLDQFQSIAVRACDRCGVEFLAVIPYQVGADNQHLSVVIVFERPAFEYVVDSYQRRFRASVVALPYVLPRIDILHKDDRWVEDAVRDRMRDYVVRDREHAIEDKAWS